VFGLVAPGAELLWGAVAAEREIWEKRKQVQNITVLLSTEQSAMTKSLRQYGHLAHRICRVLSCKPRGKRGLCRPSKRWHEIVTCQVMMIMVMQIPLEV
jgi:hypothetical protein